MSKLPYILPKKYNKVTFEYDTKYPYTPFFIVRGLAGKQHGGMDILCPIGSKVTAPGRIQQYKAYYSPSYGKVIKAYSLDVKGLEFVFAHLDVIPSYKEGKVWQKGQVFCWSGNTGFSSSPHVHLETLLYGKKVNPRKYIEFP